MKKFTHAWLAFMAVKRLDKADLSTADRNYAASLINWFMDHKDGVIQGAWYPDSVIKDMANSHVLKLTPSDTAQNKFRKLPSTYLNYEYTKNSPLKSRSFTVEKDDNLPDRCESIAHSVIDNLKMQEKEDKGSPIVPTDNHIATLLFMLSHYVADAHMPLHCDRRRFSEGMNLHGKMEGEWDDMVRRFYEIDNNNERFFYDKYGWPLKNTDREDELNASFLKNVEASLAKRDFITSWGKDNGNVWDFMSAICQYSYLLSYSFIPEPYQPEDLTSRNWKTKGSISFDDLSTAVFSDAIDSIARIWLRVWRRYIKWEKEQRKRS